MLYSKMGLNRRFAGYHKLCRSVELSLIAGGSSFLREILGEKEGKKTCPQGQEEVKAYSCKPIMETACQWLDVAP